MKNKTLAKFTKLLLDVMFYLGIAVTLALPWLFKWGAKVYPGLRDYYVFHVVMFMLSGAGAVIIIFELRRMFRTVLAENCFVWENVKSLKRMGIVSLGISAVTVGRLLLLPTPATLIIVVVFFIAGLFSFVLSGVFAQAVSYKEENDFTI